MKRFLVTLLLLPFQTFANGGVVDSLEKVLIQSKSDTQIVKTLDLLAFHISRDNPEKGISYANRILKISTEMKWPQGKAMAYSGLGLNYHALSEYQKAIHYHTLALHIYRDLGNENAQAGVMANLSNAYKAIASYPEALENGLQALKIYERNEELINEAIVSQNVGTIFLEQKNYSKAIEFYNQSMQIYSDLNHRYGVAMTLGNIAIVEGAIGNYNRALLFHQKALEINRELDESYSIQRNLANIGLIYLKLNEYQLSLSNLREALSLSEQYNAKESIAINSGNIGEAYFQMATDTLSGSGNKTRQQYIDSALKYLEKGVMLSKEIHLNGPFIEFSNILSQAYTENGNFRMAFNCLRDHTMMKDSIFSQQNQIELSNLETRRELDLKNKDNQLLLSQIEIGKLKQESKRNQIIAAVIGLSLIAFMVIVLISRMNRKLKNQSGTLSDIAYYQSHKVRGPVARILGLASLFNLNDTSDPENATLLSYIKEETEELDELIKGIVEKAARKH